MIKKDLLYPEEYYVIMGAAFEVYREFGAGFLEGVYQECLELEFIRQKIPFIAQQIITLEYKGTQLKQIYKPDFICYNKIILEIKALDKLAPEHESQVINYLRASNMKLGILINFGSYPKATSKRLINLPRKLIINENT